MTSKGEWVIADILDTSDMNNEDYKSKYQQELQVERKKWLEDCQAFTKNLHDIKAGKERDARYFQQKIEKKEREEAEKEIEVTSYVHQLQEKEKQHTESK